MSGLHRTDLGNAERLVVRHGHHLRHVAGIGWVVWDGRRWLPDTDGEVMRRAKDTVRAIYSEAADAEDPAQRKALSAWANRSEAEPRLRAAVSLAASELDVVLAADGLDADPWLLNAPNGTVDLRTGHLRQHDPADRITKLAGTPYDPEATHPAWDALLASITDGDSELEAYLARAYGYSLTGLTGEQVLFFAHGPGATGKSTFLGAILAALGDYAVTADFETFLKRRDPGGPRNDIARLAGARLVASLEVDEGARLAEGLIKGLTGGDRVTARFLHREAFTFTFQAKLWFAANARPAISANDDAMWRRVRQVPFLNVIPEEDRDPRLAAALKTPAALAAILAWGVRGCLDWQTHGLGHPDVVKAYTNSYRDENDHVGAWLDECATLEPAGGALWTLTATLRSSYEDWCKANGATPLGRQRFAATLEGRGLESGKASKGVRIWRGIALTDGTGGTGGVEIGNSAHEAGSRSRFPDGSPPLPPETLDPYGAWS